MTKKEFLPIVKIFLFVCLFIYEGNVFIVLDQLLEGGTAYYVL